VSLRAERHERRLGRVVESAVVAGVRPSASDLGLTANRTPRPIRLVLLLYAIVFVGHERIVSASIVLAPGLPG
jgi:hypothetical protein